jgi:hypothetical protein
MSEYQSAYYNMYLAETIYPYSIEIPEIITKISREITRNATLLIRLTKLLLENGESISDADYKIKRITKKLQNQLELLFTHYKTEREEFDTLKTEFDNAIIERDALHIKRKIGDICEGEYSLKLSVANWSIQDLRAKKEALENSLKAMETLKGLPVLGDIENLYQISKNNYQSLNGLKLEPYTTELLVHTLSKILETVTYSGPSTL